MRLKFYTLLTLLSISYLFIIRTVNSFLPLMFTHEVAGKSVQLLSLIAHFILLIFYILFLIQYVTPETKFLYWASVLSIISSAIMVLLYFRGLVFVFPGLESFVYHNWPSIFLLMHSPHYLLFSPFIGLINSLVMFLFLMAFYSESPDIEIPKLRIATRYAIYGVAVLILVNIGLVTIQSFTGGMGWMTPYAMLLQLVFLPIFSLVFLTKFYFFLQFYRSLKENHLDEIVSSKGN